jgi:type I restriction enzyme S subunit
MLKVPAPPLNVQRTIGAILGSLDDRIELNRQTCETLESMARALFKSWFVDFDPVRAKAEGRTPAGMDAETAALFPSEFEASDLGPIPKGWPRRKLGTAIELKRGFDLPTAQRVPGSVPIISSSGITGYHVEARAKGPGIVTGRYGTLGQVFWVPSDYWPLNTALYVSALSDCDARWAFFRLQHIDFEKFSDKAAVPGINRNDVHDEEIVLPPLPLQGCFTSIVEPWLTRAEAYRAESNTLTQLRDTLLPKLLSGAITIPDAKVFAR